ncbi:copper resistance CopC family protein [Micromonospora sp. NPDC126480]|uniref:copper resistance CopC family protein n=1 Tax=Micromonospora sp. NPDC126480 TaxID=3155312 RepID=UPI00331C5192
MASPRPAARRVWWRLAGGAAVAVLAVSVPLLALAVDRAPVRLVSVAPADGAHLRDPPENLSLTFTAPPDADGTHVAVYGAAGAVSGGVARVDGSTLTLPLDVPGAGRYRAGYHVVFGDGRELTGLVTFTVGGSGAGRSVALPSGPAVPPSAAGPAAVGPGGGGSGGHAHGAVDPITLAVLGVDAVVLAIVLMAFVRRRHGSSMRRPGPADKEQGGGRDDAVARRDDPRHRI